MTKKDKVGIALAFYNPKPDLFRAQIQSILDQSFLNWICVISIDDDIEHLLEKDLGLKGPLADKRFIIIKNRNPGGFVSNFGNALSVLLKDPELSCFVFCDQDDEWFPEMLEVQVAALREKPKGSMVFSDLSVQAVSNSGERTLIHHSIWELERRNIQNLDVDSVLMRNLVSGASGMFDRALAEKYLPIPDWVRFHDHYFAVNAAKDAKLFPIKKSLYFYNQHGGNVVGGGAYKGLLDTSNQSKRKLKDRYNYLSEWKRRLGLKDSAIRNLFRINVLLKDPTLYRSYVGYFIGKYFG